jgi:hypothetical protein
MKNTLSLVAMAAGISQVAATGWHNAKPFTNPDNTNNYCPEDVKPGFDWADLPTGGFDSYKGFKWSGFSCEDRFAKRSELVPRTFQNKCITGKATKDRDNSPKVSCDKGKGIEKTSIKEFHVTPEFDCDLEFVYTMPDSSTCKHRSACKKEGTKVTNTQCGGAVDVVIVFPEQENVPKEDCDFGIPSMIFDCETASSTPPAVPSTSSYPANSPPTSYPVTTSSSSVATTSSYPASSAPVTSSSTAPVTTSYPASSAPVTSSSSAPVSYPAGNSSSIASTTSYPAEVPTTSYPAEGPSTTSYPAEGPSSPAEVPSSSYPAEVPSSSYPAEGPSSPAEVPSSSYPADVPSSSYPAEGPSSSSPATSSTTAGVPITSVTSYMTTSTVYTTAVSTITSCGPEVPDCPAGSTAVVTETLAVSTTVCPVTETYTTIPTGGAEVPVPTGEGEVPVPTGEGESPVPSTPVEPLPCPELVPSCLNTFMYQVQCRDNTDSACFCPDSAFTQNVFECLYAHGASDEEISEAISYFQGICAPYATENPGIVTCPGTITNILTAAPTPAPTAVYTTIEVVATTVVPCTDEAGVEIPSSSTTVTESYTVSVPDVAFTTVTDTPGATDVVVVPGPAVTATATAAPSAGPSLVAPTTAPLPTGTGAAAPYPTGSAAFTTFTTGTGSLIPSVPTSAPAFATAGAPRLGAGMGFFGLVAAAVAIL